MKATRQGWPRKVAVVVGLMALIGVMWLMVLPGAAADFRPRPGQKAPDFRLVTTTGEVLNLSDLRGRPVVLNFWAIWCVPCRTEMPLLTKVYQQHQDQGLAVIGINLRESRVAVTEFGRRYELSFPLLLDHDLSVARRYGIIPLPTTLFIDREGVIQSRYEGELNSALLADRLLSVLAEPRK